MFPYLSDFTFKPPLNTVASLAYRGITQTQVSLDAALLLRASQQRSWTRVGSGNLDTYSGMAH